MYILKELNYETRKNRIQQADKRSSQRSINGVSKNGEEYQFNTGTCFDKKLPLGEIRTDEKGRLVVLGGFGKSDSPVGNEIVSYANNDGWYDDTSDGPVKATVVLKSGRKIPVIDNAWVIVAPPKFAPYHYPIITLFDVMQELAFDQKWLEPPKDVSFKHDIYPILSHAVQYKWLNLAGNRGHGINKEGSFLAAQTLKSLASKDSDSYDLRKKVFDRLRDPKLYSDQNINSDEALQQATPTYMPQLSGDTGDNSVGHIRTWLALLPRQYENMRRWKDGDFVSDWEEDSSMNLHPNNLKIFH